MQQREPVHQTTPPQDQRPAAWAQWEHAITPRPRWKTPLIATGALVVGIIIGAALHGSSTTPAAAPPVTTGPTTTAVTTLPGNAPAVSPPVAPVAAPDKTVVLKTSGNGQKTTKQFTINQPDWSLAYTYDCAGNGGTGNFQVYEDYPAGSILANALSDKGGDTTYQHGDAGQHSLTINSECAWSITVTDGDNG